MDGLDILGAVEGLSKPKKGAVFGGVVGTFVGAAAGVFFWPARRLFAGLVGGLVAGPALGAGLGYGIGRTIERKDAQAMVKAGKPGAPGALPAKKAA